MYVYYIYIMYVDIYIYIYIMYVRIYIYILIYIYIYYVCRYIYIYMYMGLYGYGSKLDTPISWLLILKMNWLKSIVPKSLILTHTHIWCLVLSWIIRFYLVISWTFGRYSLTPMQYGDFLWHGGTANHRSHGWSWLSIETHGDLGIYFKNPLGCMPCDVLSDMPTKMGYIPTQQWGFSTI